MPEERQEKKIIRLPKKIAVSSPKETSPQKRITLKKKNPPNTAPKKVKRNKTVQKKKKRNFTVKVCTSLKSCGDNYGPYIWERVCNEHGQPHESESFEANGITYTKSQCQGFCKRKSNVQVENNDSKKRTQFHYMNPIKTAKLMSTIESGANPDNIRRL